MADKYKVIWTERDKLKGESYDNKLHSKSDAERVAKKAKEANKKYKMGAKVKIVKAIMKKKKTSGFNMGEFLKKETQFY